jgi:quercetin dioxygenase-like cupin family protein
MVIMAPRPGASRGGRPFGPVGRARFHGLDCTVQSCERLLARVLWRNGMAEQPRTAGVLATTADAFAVPDDRGGAVWRLTPAARQLDANLVRLPPGTRRPGHVEPDLDVLLCVVHGSGELVTQGVRQELEPGCVAWLPHGMERSVAAGPDGLVYVTAHRRRPGLAIGNVTANREAAGGVGAVAARETPGGEPACMLGRICPECDRPAEDPGARYCSRCGARLPS